MLQLCVFWLWCIHRGSSHCDTLSHSSCFSFETCWQMTISETAYSVVKKSVGYLIFLSILFTVFGSKCKLLVSLSDFVEVCVVTAAVNFTFKREWAVVLIPLFHICTIEADTVVRSAMKYHDTNSSKRALRGNTTQG